MFYDDPHNTNIINMGKPQVESTELIKVTTRVLQMRFAYSMYSTYGGK